MIEIDETKLSQQDLNYLDELLFHEFHRPQRSIFKKAHKEDCRKIIKIRLKLGLDVQGNFMISDYECEFNEKLTIK